MTVTSQKKINNYSNLKIGVVGLGYVGLPLAVEFGKFRSVLGFDIDKERIEELKNGDDKTKEISRADLMSSSLLEFSGDYSKLRDCGIFIVTVPTPIDAARRPDLKFLENACEIIGKVINRGSIVIFESTVFPGCTEEFCVPKIEAISGLSFNRDFYCGYSPERINPGDKINKLTKIKKITSGSTPEIADVVDALYAEIIQAGTYKVSSLKVAEAAKIIENCQRDLNIALVNELSVIFEKIKIDTSEVLKAAGTKWNFINFTPGLVGGHCIGVDPYYLTHKAEELGYTPQVILAGRRINDNMAVYAARNLIKLMLKNGIDVAKSTIGVLGITFKENCPDIRNSKVVDLIKELEDWGAKIVVVDPWVDAKLVQKTYGIQMGVIDLNNRIDSLVVAVAHDKFRKLSPKNLRILCRSKKPVLADLKALYDQNEIIKEGFSCYRL